MSVNLGDVLDRVAATVAPDDPAIICDGEITGWGALDRRANAHQEMVSTQFASTMNKMREDMTTAVKDSVKVTTDYTRALSSGIVSLNGVLKELGEKQVVIHQTVKKSFFSRG